jgi:hypothetical protein
MRGHPRPSSHVIYLNDDICADHLVPGRGTTPQSHGAACCSTAKLWEVLKPCRLHDTSVCRFRRAWCTRQRACCVECQHWGWVGVCQWPQLRRCCWVTMADTGAVAATRRAACSASVSTESAVACICALDCLMTFTLTLLRSQSTGVGLAIQSGLVELGISEILFKSI